MRLRHVSKKPAAAGVVERLENISIRVDDDCQIEVANTDHRCPIGQSEGFVDVRPVSKVGAADAGVFAAVLVIALPVPLPHHLPLLIHFEDFWIRVGSRAVVF